MTDQLPACSTFHQDRYSYRVWKRILHDAGKRRAFDLLEPKIRELSKKIRNRRSIYADTSSLRPTDRKRKLLDAFTEIRESRDLVHATEIDSDRGVFLYGTTGVTLHVLAAGACLVSAMLADRNFELCLMGCVIELAEIDAQYVQNVGLELQRKL